MSGLGESFPDICRYITIFDRLMKMYYDRCLADFGIGWGQQFYVEYLYDHPGASAQEMVGHIRVDKATLTKVIKRLTEIGYVRAVQSSEDGRVRHLYLTDEALPAARRIKEVHLRFYNAMSLGVPLPELHCAESALERMMENINGEVRHRMEKEN